MKRNHWRNHWRGHGDFEELRGLDGTAYAALSVDTANLDGLFTADQLRTIAALMDRMAAESKSPATLGAMDGGGE